MKYPIIKCLFFFSLGILLNINFNLRLQTLFLFLLVGSLSILILVEFLLKKNKFFKINILEFLIAFLLVVSGIVIVNLKDTTGFPNYVKNDHSLINQEHEFEVSIIQPIKINKKKVSVIGALISCKKENAKKIIVGNILIHLAYDTSSAKLLPGDVIQFSSKLIELLGTGNPHEFDYAKYLKNKQIEYHSYVNSQWTIINHFNTLSRFSTITKNKCLNIFKNYGLKSDELAIASALTFGYKDELSNSIKGIFSKTGAMHVLAVSGLHVGIIYLIISSLFKLIKLSYNLSWIKEIIILLLIWVYAIITGLSPSVLRAATMMSFLVFANIFNKNSSIYNTLGLSAFFMLIIDPFLIIDVGFQLSFLAVIGIVYIYPIIFNLVTIKNYFLIKLWTILCVSVAAQIATFPLSIFYFHQFPNLFLISNMVVIPLVFVLLVLGLSILILSFNISLSSLIVKFYSFLLSLLIKILSYLESIPFSVSKGLFISSYETLLLYTVIFLFFLFVEFKTLLIIRLLLTFFSILISIDLIEDYFFLRQKKITIYNVSNHIAIDLINGKNHFFLADQALINNPAKIKFHIENNWHFNDLNSPEIISLKNYISKTIRWENLTIAFVDSNWRDTNDVNIAIIINTPKLADGLFNNSSVKIIQNGRSFINKLKINNKLIKNNPTIYDVFKRGSYIYELQ